MHEPVATRVEKRRIADRLEIHIVVGNEIPIGVVALIDPAQIIPDPRIDRDSRRRRRIGRPAELFLKRRENLWGHFGSRIRPDLVRHRRNLRAQRDRIRRGRRQGAVHRIHRLGPHVILELEIVRGICLSAEDGVAERIRGRIRDDPVLRDRLPRLDGADVARRVRRAAVLLERESPRQPRPRRRRVDARRIVRPVHIVAHVEEDILQHRGARIRDLGDERRRCRPVAQIAVHHEIWRRRHAYLQSAGQRVPPRVRRGRQRARDVSKLKLELPVAAQHRASSRIRAGGHVRARQDTQPVRQRLAFRSHRQVAAVEQEIGTRREVRLPRAERTCQRLQRLRIDPSPTEPEAGRVRVTDHMHRVERPACLEQRADLRHAIAGGVEHAHLENASRRILQQAGDQQIALGHVVIDKHQLVRARRCAGSFSRQGYGRRLLTARRKERLVRGWRFHSRRGVAEDAVFEGVEEEFASEHIQMGWGWSGMELATAMPPWMRC